MNNKNDEVLLDPYKMYLKMNGLTEGEDTEYERVTVAPPREEPQKISIKALEITLTPEEELEKSVIVNALRSAIANEELGHKSNENDLGIKVIDLNSNGSTGNEVNLSEMRLVKDAKELKEDDILYNTLLRESISDQDSIESLMSLFNRVPTKEKSKDPLKEGLYKKEVKLKRNKKEEIITLAKSGEASVSIETDLGFKPKLIDNKLSTYDEEETVVHNRSNRTEDDRPQSFYLGDLKEEEVLKPTVIVDSFDEGSINNIISNEIRFMIEVVSRIPEIARGANIPYTTAVEIDYNKSCTEIPHVQPIDIELGSAEGYRYEEVSEPVEEVSSDTEKRIDIIDISIPEAVDVEEPEEDFIGISYISQNGEDNRTMTTVPTDEPIDMEFNSEFILPNLNEQVMRIANIYNVPVIPRVTFNFIMGPRIMKPISEVREIQLESTNSLRQDLLETLSETGPNRDSSGNLTMIDIGKPEEEDESPLENVVISESASDNMSDIDYFIKNVDDKVEIY